MVTLRVMVCIAHGLLLMSIGTLLHGLDAALVGLSIVTSTAVFTEAHAQQVDDAPERAPLETATGVLLLIMVLATAVRIGSAHPAAQAGGLVLCAAGIALRATAMRTLGRQFTTHLQGEATLITHGIYRHLRHPSEWGLAIYGGGLAVLAHHPAVTAAWALSLLVAVVRVGREERALRAHLAQRPESS